MKPTSVGGPFDLVTGLPLHPLVVHAAVVFVPLAAIGVIVLVLVPRTRPTWSWPVLATLVLGALSSFLSAESGEALEHRIGNPGNHAELGKIMMIGSIAMLLVAGTWIWMTLRSKGAPALRTALGVVSALGAVVAIVLMVVVGHTGAQKAWEDVAGTTTQAEEPAVRQRG